MKKKYVLEIAKVGRHQHVCTPARGSNSLLEKAKWGITYDILDAETGKGLGRVALRNNGKDLVAEIGDQATVLIDDFFAESLSGPASTCWWNLAEPWLSGWLEASYSSGDTASS